MEGQYETQFTEDFDSRLADKEWKNRDYNDSRWINAIEGITDDHKLYLQETRPVDVYEIKPAVYKKINQGHFICQVI